MEYRNQSSEEMLNMDIKHQTPEEMEAMKTVFDVEESHDCKLETKGFCECAKYPDCPHTSYDPDSDYENEVNNQAE